MLPLSPELPVSLSHAHPIRLKIWIYPSNAVGPIAQLGRATDF